MKNSLSILLLTTMLITAGCVTKPIDVGISRSFKDSNTFVHDFTTHRNSISSTPSLNNRLSAPPVYFLDYKLSDVLDEKVDAHSVDVTEFNIAWNDPNSTFKTASALTLGLLGAIISETLSTQKSYISCRFEGKFHDQKILVKKISACPDKDITCYGAYGGPGGPGTANEAPEATRKIIKDLTNECTDEVISQINSIKTLASTPQPDAKNHD